MSVRQGKFSLLQQAESEKKRRDLSLIKNFSDLSVYEQLKHVLPGVELYDKQREFVNAKQFEKWYIGGYKSGKTFLGVCLSIFISFVNRPYPTLIVHPTSDGIEITLLPLFEKICDVAKIEYTLKRLSTKIIATLRFGNSKKDFGKIIFASGDRPRSLKGPNVASALIDEPFIMKEEIVNVVVSRISEANAVMRHLLFTGTFEPFHMTWGFDLAKESNSQSNHERFIVKASTRENLYLPENYVKNLESQYDKRNREVYIEGNYINMNLNSVYTFSSENICDNEIKNRFLEEPENRNLRNSYNLILSFDFNVNPICAVLLLQIENTYIQIEEFKVSNSYTEELCRLIIPFMVRKGYLTGEEQIRTCFNNSLIITGDASGRGRKTASPMSDYQIIFEQFTNERIDFTKIIPPSNPEVRDRVNYINKLLQTRNFLIHKRCEHSIRDREFVQWKMGADGFFIDKSKKDLTHLSEACDYGIWNTRILIENAEENVINYEFRNSRN